MGNKTNKKRKRKHQLRGIAKKRKDANTGASRLQPTNSNCEIPPLNDHSDQLPAPLVPDDNGPCFDEEPKNDSSTLNVSASEKKIGGNLESTDFEVSDDDKNCFLLVDSSILCSFLDSKLFCDQCGQHIKSQIFTESGKGFCFTIKSYCQNCDTKTFLFNTSKPCRKGVFEGNQRQTPHEINARMIVFAREIGLGLSSLEIFSKCINTPPPINQGLYENIFDKLLAATKMVAQKSVQRAAQELLEDQGGDQDVMVSVDDTWQRRGRNSHNGAVTAVSVVSGKAFDVEVLSNYCKGCAQWKEEEKKSPAFQEWIQSYQLTLNHDGRAGAMEPEGVVRIFARSELERGLRYMEYLEDGDSSSFLKVKESKPHGEHVIKKNECIGHIQKRLGTRLRKLCDVY